MGLIVDTSILIEAERHGGNLEGVFARLAGRGTLAISAVTLMELAHGVARAKPEAVRVERERFLAAVQQVIRVLPLDGTVALRAGILNGTLRGQGFSIGLADAMIAVTALVRGDSVATLNVKDFAIVPGLDVVEL